MPQTAALRDHGYEQHKNILLDVIDHIFPEAGDLVETNAHERVEVIPQRYILNIPENIGKTGDDGLIVHLVNLSGFSGNTYFRPHPMRDLRFRIRSGFKPTEAYAMVSHQPIEFSTHDGYVEFEIEELGQYEGVILKR